MGRHNKILSPSKIKLMHLLKDDQTATTFTFLGMGLHEENFMVQPLLEKSGAEGLLIDRISFLLCNV